METLTPEVARRFIPAHPNTLNGAELAAVLEAGEIVASYMKLAETEAEARIKAGKPVDGWELVKTPGRMAIPDTIKAARQLAPLLERDEILACAKLSIGKVEDAIKAAEGCTEKEARDIAADYLKGNMLKGAGGEKLQMAPKQANELHPTTRAALRELAQTT